MRLFPRANARRALKTKDVAKLYDRPPSFTDLLPWTTYLPESKCFVLDDGISVGAALELFPVSTEAVSDDVLINVRDALQVVLLDAIPEEPDQPWVLQFFLQDDYDLTSFKRSVAAYGNAEISSTPYATFFQELFNEHLDRISRSGGAFVDQVLTGTEWRGKIRRIRVTLYQRLSRRRLRPKDDPEQHLSEVLARFRTALDVAGVVSNHIDLFHFREWLLPWFNPKPAFAVSNSRTLIDVAGEVPDPLPLNYDVAQDLVFSQPRSDAQNGAWWFDGIPHEVISVQGLRRLPEIGHLSAERRHGDHIQTLFDGVPVGTVLAVATVVQSQNVISDQVARIKKAAVGETADAKLTREHVLAVERELAAGNKLFPTTLAFYIRGVDLQEVRKHRNQLSMLLLANGLQPIAEEADLLILDSYLRNLPMAYDHGFDQTRRRSKLMFARAIANLMPVYGRARGAGHPGFVFFNRGAEPFCFDPLAATDRKKNAHLLVLGPSGAGKSAMLVYLLQQVMARHRPRIFIVEAGGSFELLGEHFKAHGLSVHHIKLQPNSGVRLPPFIHARSVAASRDTGDLNRDYLGEMEIIARVMITGGDAREHERLTRADRMLIRQAILDAGRAAVDRESDVLTENVVEALRHVDNDGDLPASRLLRAQEMADSMALFTSGVAGRFFNRPGSDWPDADVTIFEIGLLAREGYEDQLSVAYLSLMSHINDLVEKHQQTNRQTLVVTDEGHVVLTHPLLANYVVKITKMWRKYGAWFWIATQNLADFPDQSKRMLSMIEWWLCLAMPKDEIEQLARFRELSPADRLLLSSARKEPGKYVEGVVLSDELKSLFRNVPPALSLALAQTEKHEKSARREIMQRTGCTEYDAACVIAEQIKGASFDSSQTNQ